MGHSGPADYNMNSHILLSLLFYNDNKLNFGQFEAHNFCTVKITLIRKCVYFNYMYIKLIKRCIYAECLNKKNFLKEINHVKGILP